MIKKLYYQFKRYNIKIAKEKAERKGVAFDEKLYAKRQDASLPILLYYGFFILFTGLFPGLVELIPFWTFWIILLVLVIRGLNNYFGWIRIEDR